MNGPPSPESASPGPIAEESDATSPSRLEEHRRAAHRAGLNYVTDGTAGIQRKRNGKGWTFLAPDDVRIADRAERKRIQALAIPQIGRASCRERV